jgi:threonine-phosphate decarboxylase
MLHGHGDDVAGNININFSSNVWYGADKTGLQNHLAANLYKINRYPEILPHKLTAKIASYHGLAENTILVTNGATEAIYLIAHAFSDSNTSIVYPTFSEYADAGQLFRHTLHFIEECELPRNTKFNDRLVFICNPNNPTGKAYPKEYIENLLRNNRDTLFIIDEAYADFTLMECPAINLVNRYPNLIIIRSLTKKFCIPGLRLGYMVANEKHIRKIVGFKMPWSVNTLAMEAGEYLFDSIEQYQIPLQTWLNETLWLRNQINTMPQFKAKPSDTSYFLCETLRSNATSLKKYLMDEFGILIRDASNFKGLMPGSFRICTQTHHENIKLIEALKKWTTRF